MSAKFAAMMPHALNRAITVCAWLAAPLWITAIGAAVAGLPDRGMVLLTGASVSSTCCALRVWHERLVDARITQGFAVHEQHEADLALLTGTMMNSGLVKVAPIPQPDGTPDLRLVENA